jgi:integrase
LERTTIDSYRQHLRDHIEPLIGGIFLRDLTIPAVRDFMDVLRGAGRSPAMIRRVVGDLGSILANAMERGLVAQNVVHGMSRRRKKDRKVEKRHERDLKKGVDIPTLDEVRAIIASLRGRWRPMILTAFFTGLRASELRGLKWPDVDLQKSELTVSQRADKYLTLGSPKSDAGKRTVPLPPLLANALREWKLQCPRTDLGLVFPTEKGNVFHHTNIVQRGWNPAQVRAGVVGADGKAKYNFHAARHFYASWCANSVKDGGLGLSPKVVQARMGHSSITVTLDLYSHLFPRGDDGGEMAEAERKLHAV